MKLLTKKIISALPHFYKTGDFPLNDKIVICKFFTPDSNWSWYVFEGEPVKDEGGKETGDFEFFGMVHGHENELGYFFLSELQKIKGLLGLPIERDLHVFKVPYDQLINKGG